MGQLACTIQISPRGSQDTCAHLASWTAHRDDLRLERMDRGGKPRARHCLQYFLNDTATSDICTLSLHDALPIYHVVPYFPNVPMGWDPPPPVPANKPYDGKAAYPNTSRIA